MTLTHHLLAVAMPLAMLSGSVLSMPLSASTSGGDQSSCDCFKASSSSEAYFAHHKFFDFRNKGSGSSFGSRSVSASAFAVPQPITDRAQDAAAPVTNAYFSSNEWTDTWDIQNWSTGDGPVFRVNSKNNMYFVDSGSASSYLTMRTTRQSDHQSTSEFQTTSANYQFLSVRMYARTRGSPGAVTAMFTYLGSSPVQEADLEIRTERPTHEAQYTNQPSYNEGDDAENPDATSVVNMATPWTDWQEHRYDWSPGLSEWYVNGEKVASITFQAPVDPTTLIFNVWGDGGIWSGKMAPGGTAQMDIQWIDLAYNNTEQAPASACTRVCVVDDLISS